MTRWTRILISVDQLANVVFLNGMPDETISARVWREDNKRMIGLINTLFFWQANHCLECYKWEQDRKDLPTDYQGERDGSCNSSKRSVS